MDNAHQRFLANVTMMLTAQGRTKTDLAGHLGTSRAYVHQILAGSSIPSLVRAEQISRFFGYDLPDFLSATLVAPKKRGAKKKPVRGSCTA